MRLLALAALLLSTTAVYGSDLPNPILPQKAVRAAPPPTTPWTGMYLGGNFGYGFQNTDVTAGASVPGIFPTDFRTAPQGWMGGAQIGYNYQVGAFVLGAEADIDAANISASNSQGVPAIGVSAMTSQKLDWLTTYRAKFGILPFQHFLVYGTGGLAGAGVTTASNACAGSCGATSIDSTLWGWTAGGGIEVLVNDHWSVKAEGLYYDLGQVSGSFSTAGGAAVINFNSEYKGLLGRVGANYRF
jgi:outer membrane immunogenic protein